jgi:hypothetical protein
MSIPSDWRIFRKIYITGLKLFNVRSYHYLELLLVRNRDNLRVIIYVIKKQKHLGQVKCDHAKYIKNDIYRGGNLTI